MVHCRVADDTLRTSFFASRRPHSEQVLGYFLLAIDSCTTLIYGLHYVNC